jgi:hypothetical protein
VNLTVGLLMIMFGLWIPGAFFVLLWCCLGE